VFLIEPEPTRFDLRWQMFGIPVRVHPLFWLVSLLLGYDGIMQSNLGKEYLLVWVGCVFVSILVHELGHVLMGMIFGSRGHIVMYSMGGLAIGSKDVDRRWQRILVSLAGPLAQLLLLFVPVFVLLFLWRPSFLANANEYVLTTLFFLLEINLFWALLNLLPIWPLDGGQITRELCEWFSRDRGVKISLGISLAVAGFLALHGLFTRINHGESPLAHLATGPYTSLLLLLLPTGLYMTIFFALFAITSYQALQAENYRRRQWEDDDWRWER
jgi:Zn-dependent protease